MKQSIQERMVDFATQRFQNLLSLQVATMSVSEKVESRVGSVLGRIRKAPGRVYDRFVFRVGH